MNLYHIQSFTKIVSLQEQKKIINDLQQIVFNQMQVTAIGNSKNYYKFLDEELLFIEHNSAMKIEEITVLNHNQSQQLLNHKHNHLNLHQAIVSQFMSQENEKDNARHKRKQSFSRESLSALNKKQTNIRKSNYSLHKLKSKESSIEIQHLKIKEATIVRAQSTKSKRPFSSLSHRVFRSPSVKDCSQKGERTRPYTATRPQKSASQLSKIQIDQNTKKYFEFRKQNPLVVYPFESHLKMKRVDQNPKMLANIITRKNKTMDKLDLYEYVSKIMERRSK